MKERVKNYILTGIGLFLISWWLVAVIETTRQLSFVFIFWFSYLALLVIGVGCLVRSPLLIQSQLNFLAIPFIVWSLDFIYVFIAQQQLFGFTNYFFQGETTLLDIIAIQHFFIVPLALYALTLMKIKRKDSWKVTLLYLLGVFIASFLITTPQTSINCVHDFSCLPFSVPFYPVAWFVFFSVLTFITSALFIHFLFVKQKRKS